MQSAVAFERKLVKQTTFASVAYDRKGKVTRRERFLSEMDQVIPWSQILKLIEPHYPKAGNGTQPMPLGRMLRKLVDGDRVVNAGGSGVVIEHGTATEQPALFRALEQGSVVTRPI